MKTALYHIRTRCNYSQSMAARELRVSRQVFGAWEQGKKPIPEGRKAMLSALFGVPAQVLDSKDEREIQNFCDRPMFSTICQGKQVFSFRPRQAAQHVFLGAPSDTRPEDRCHALMAQKNGLMEHLNALLSFAPAQQVDQLPDMELRISMLGAFCGLIDLTEEMEPQYRSRLLRFLLEQMELLARMLRGGSSAGLDVWSLQQLQLLRCRWGQQNRPPEPAKRANPGEAEPGEILDRVHYWYQQAKASGDDWLELQWKLNQQLEQEYTHEMD